MWKSGLTVVYIRIVFHSRCGKRCGKVCFCVEKELEEKVFHISTGHLSSLPVEMWKTFGQFIENRQVSRKDGCGKQFTLKVS
jgi:hypothetical protein